jgi:hypothetical protein
MVCKHHKYNYCLSKYVAQLNVGGEPNLAMITREGLVRGHRKGIHVLRTQSHLYIIMLGENTHNFTLS